MTLRRFGVQSAAVDLPRSAADDEDLSSGRGRGSVVCSVRITGANVCQHAHSTAFRGHLATCILRKLRDMSNMSLLSEEKKTISCTVVHAVVRKFID